MRLQRIGRKNDPSYRVLIVDSRQGPKSGKYIDQIGTHNPKLNQTAVDGAKAKEWIGKGVQVSGTVHNILVSQNILEGKKVNVLPKKSPIVSEVKEEETVAETPEVTESEKSEEAVAESTPIEKDEAAPTVAREAKVVAPEEAKVEEVAVVEDIKESKATSNEEIAEEKKEEVVEEKKEEVEEKKEETGT